MGFTTYFGLHSQTTRLWKAPRGAAKRRADGVLTLSDAPFQGTWAAADRGRFSRLQFPPKGDFQVGLFPVRSPLLRESWLVSFPPLIDMLKFSGYLA